MVCTIGPCRSLRRVSASLFLSKHDFGLLSPGCEFPCIVQKFGEHDGEQVFVTIDGKLGGDRNNHPPHRILHLEIYGDGVGDLAQVDAFRPHRTASDKRKSKQVAKRSHSNALYKEGLSREIGRIELSVSFLAYIPSGFA
jgi:hypothetical protein